MSTFQDLPKYNCDQNLTHLKNQSGAVYGRSEQCKYGETTNVSKFSSWTIKEQEAMEGFAFPDKRSFFVKLHTLAIKKHSWPTNFTELFRTLVWQPLSSKGAKVTLHGQTNQDTPNFPYLRQPSWPQSVLSEVSNSVFKSLPIIIIGIGMQQ